MEKKTPPPMFEGRESGTGRHRFTGFGDEDTRILPLSEIIKGRATAPPPLPPKAPSKAEFAGERTQMVAMPQGFPGAAPAAEAPPPQPTPEAGAQARAAVSGPRQVVAFISAKGGSGATLLAVNAAHHYARERGNTCLVDLDLQMGDALASLSLQPRLTIAQALTALKRGESLALATLARHASGLSVLSQVGYIDDLDVVVPEGIGRLIENLRQGFETIVVDGIRDFSDNALAVLDMSDAIAIVTVQEVLAIRRARWSFGILKKVGFDAADITIIVNRFNPESDMSFAALKQIFAPAQVMVIPMEAAAATQSQDRGIPLYQLNPSGSLTRNLGRLANQLAGEGQSEETAATVIRGAGSFWKRLAFWRQT